MYQAIQSLQQSWQMPTRLIPIIIVGSGGIVNDAHLPAYKKAGFPVLGIYDLDQTRARETAKRWQIPTVFFSLAEAYAHQSVVFDLALPPAAIASVLQQLPDNASVLIQKPMGADFAEAKNIVAICQNKQLTAAVNHQLRFAAYMLAVRDALQKGWLGTLTDVEMNLNVADPWHLFPFLEKMQRVEIQVHSIHYLDLIRSLMGEPQGVYALTLADARFPKLTSTRSSIILNYGNQARVSLALNHNFPHGEEGQNALFKFEGTRGVIWVQIGVMLDYPKGKPDFVHVKLEGRPRETLVLTGSWFPDAFIGPMANLQRFIQAEDSQLLTSVEDVLNTMALVEAAYISSASGGVPLPK